MGVRWLLAAGVASAVIVAAAVPGVHGDEIPVRFEFVSVRPSLTTGPESFRVLPGGRLEAARAQLMGLIRVAYGFDALDPRLVAQGASWMYSERFDILALNGLDWNPASADGYPPTLRPLLRTLLEDHFDVRTSIRARVMRVQALRVAQPGPGLQEAAGTCTRPGAEPPGDLAVARPCRERVDRAMQNGGIEAESVHLADVARMVGQLLSFENLVVDGTGLAGRFDVQLTIDVPPGGRGAPRDQYAAEVRRAVQQQLGLRLERTRAPVEMLVVERASRPRE